MSLKLHRFYITGIKRQSKLIFFAHSIRYITCLIIQIN
ncbi:hypothetical protein LPE509_02807 [Legionella pneumophila subsp. pneumophila LPE509]|nr:hypothetical protein LPE509_02807 [Legionella pneumophila subsp. pneumophila LPE509]